MFKLSHYIFGKIKTDYNTIKQNRCQYPNIENRDFIDWNFFSVFAFTSLHTINKCNRKMKCISTHWLFFSVVTLFQKSIEVTDGWYSTKLFLDCHLSFLISKGKLKIGQKLCISNAEIVGSDTACSPLEVNISHFHDL